eukprot:5993449-Amphidinium_carterae.1
MSMCTVCPNHLSTSWHGGESGCSGSSSITGLKFRTKTTLQYHLQDYVGKMAPHKLFMLEWKNKTPLLGWSGARICGHSRVR